MVKGCELREKDLDRLEGSFPSPFRILAKSCLTGSELDQGKKRPKDQELN